jgi:hypothetical protein
MQEERKRLVLRALPVLVVIAVVALFYAWRWMTSTDSTNSLPVETSTASPPIVIAEGSAFGPLEAEWVEMTGSPPEWPDDFDRPSDCAAVLDELKSLAGKADEGDYAKLSGARQGTFELLFDVSESLERKKPSIGGRLDDGDAMRANIVHFMIALGPQRLAQLVQLSRKQSRLAEPLALGLYRWMRAGDSCGDSRHPPSAETQYEYAAFLLQTIGGQAYLRRRTPRLEALTSFYSLLLADAAIADGYNPHGLDLRPEIARSKALMEMQPLVFRNQYLRVLESLDRRWRNPESIGL